MNKINRSCFVVLFLINTSAEAGNFYVGAAAIKDNAQYHFTRIETAPGVSFSDTDRFDWSGDGFAAEIYGGYKINWRERFSISLEGFYDRSSNRGNIQFIDTNSLYTRLLNGQFKQRWQYGVGLLPGIYFSENNLFFGKIAYVIDNIQLSGNILQTGAIGAFQGFFSSDKDRKGVELGIGMEMNIYKQISARVEWDWLSVQNFSNSSQVRANNQTFTTFRTASNPQLEQIKLGLNWAFA